MAILAACCLTLSTTPESAEDELVSLVELVELGEDFGVGMLMLSGRIWLRVLISGVATSVPRT